MFNQLYKLNEAVEIERESDDVWAVAAKGDEHNVMLSYYNDDDNAPEKTVKLEFKNVNNPNGVRLEYYCLDANRDCELIREEVFTSTTWHIIDEGHITTIAIKKSYQRQHIGEAIIIKILEDCYSCGNH